jgi:hypothetical protein
MNIRMNVEIHFYEQEKASVFLESFSEASDERLGEASLLVMFAIRMISNLGTTDTTDRLAAMLVEIPWEIHGLASGATTGGLQLIPHPGPPGRKQFHAKLTMDDRRRQFGFQAKGFGWLATGINYYGPVSVLALLRHLAMKRPEDKEFLTSIAAAIGMVGKAQFSRQIQLSNHDALAGMILGEACLPQLA